MQRFFISWKTFFVADFQWQIFILGLQVTKDRSQRNIMLGQLNYIKGALIKFEINACKPITTPLDLGAKLSKNQSPSSTKRRMWNG